MNLNPPARLILFIMLDPGKLPCNTMSSFPGFPFKAALFSREDKCLINRTLDLAHACERSCYCCAKRWTYMVCAFLSAVNRDVTFSFLQRNPRNVLTRCARKRAKQCMHDSTSLLVINRLPSVLPAWLARFAICLSFVEPGAGPRERS